MEIPISSYYTFSSSFRYLVIMKVKTYDRMMNDEWKSFIKVFLEVDSGLFSTFRCGLYLKNDVLSHSYHSQAI